MIDSTLTAAAPIASADVASLPISEALRRLAGRRVYFAHQSVGGNLLDGVQAILRSQPDAALKLVETHDPASIAGPAFVHFKAGRNEDPTSKNTDFMRVLDARASRDGGIALLKYCFIDVNAGTDIDAVFRDYRSLVGEVKKRHPDLTLVHVTMPLTTDQSGLKASIKRAIGRTTTRELNQKRSRFNDLLRKEFGREPLFDLAGLEATRSDGTLERVMVGGQPVYALSLEYTTDGGHLNQVAERRFAERLLTVLAAAPQRDVR